MSTNPTRINHNALATFTNSLMVWIRKKENIVHKITQYQFTDNHNAKVCCKLSWNQPAGHCFHHFAMIKTRDVRPVRFCDPDPYSWIFETHSSPNTGKNLKKCKTQVQWRNWWGREGKSTPWKAKCKNRLRLVYISILVFFWFSVGCWLFCVFRSIFRWFKVLVYPTTSGITSISQVIFSECRLMGPYSGQWALFSCVSRLAQTSSYATAQSQTINKMQLIT